MICPLNWISSWICYCSDDIEYPYPTYGIDYFLNRLFSTMKMAFDVELEKKEEEPNSQVDTGTKCFGVEMLTRRRDITKLDEEDGEENEFRIRRLHQQEIAHARLTRGADDQIGIRQNISI